MLRHIAIESILTGPSTWLVESPCLIALRRGKVLIQARVIDGRDSCRVRGSDGPDRYRFGHQFGHEIRRFVTDCLGQCGPAMTDSDDEKGRDGNHTSS